MVACAAFSAETRSDNNSRKTPNLKTGERLAEDGRTIVQDGYSQSPGGCSTGLRKVAGVYHCPPDDPQGGRTPVGYYWDPARTDGVALGQTLRTDRWALT